jgi:hypothetical protein
VPLAVPDWNEQRALSDLDIERITFASSNGNCQGYATARQVAVSPIAYQPGRTLVHEVAHAVLGHTAEFNMTDGNEATPRDIREVEAEAVSYLVCQSLGLCDGVFSRGYLQHWLGNRKHADQPIDEHGISDKSAHRIFHAADVILKAGRLAPASESSDSAD